MIFVTGASGFIGSYIVQELVSQGKSVRLLRRKRSLPFFMPENLSDKVSWVEGDILDVGGLPENMEGCDQIIHTAGMVSFNPGDKEKLFKINIEGTANMVNAAIELGIQDFIHVSSVAALGKSDGGKPIDEQVKWSGIKGQSSYGISKYYGEMEVWRGMGEGLRPVIVNPAIILGYGDWNESSSAIFKSVYEEFPWYTTGTNGFASVQDTARAIVRLLNSPIRNERFIIGGETRTYQEIFDWIAEGFGKKKPTREATAFLSSIAWRMEKIKSMFTGNNPLLTRESAILALSHTVYDSGKLLKALPDFHFGSMKESVYSACVQYKQYAEGLKARR